MAKIIFFLLTIFIIIYPIFFSKSVHKNIKKDYSKKPLIEIFNGTYKKFNLSSIELNGSFSKAEIFKNYYHLFDLLSHNILKRESYFSKDAVKQNNLIKGKNVKYRNENYILEAKKAFYCEKKKFLKGYDFNFSSIKAKGRGKYFEVDKNKHIFAKNVTYFIKVDE
jgi:hypothetical protein